MIPLAGKPAELGLLRGLTPPAPVAGTNPERGFEFDPGDEREPSPVSWVRLGEVPAPSLPAPSPPDRCPRALPPGERGEESLAPVAWGLASRGKSDAN